MVDYYAIDCSGENVCGYETDLEISFFHGKKRNKPVWVGVDGEDGLGNKGFGWWADGTWWGDNGGWLPMPAAVVSCECEVSGGNGFRFRWF